MKLLHIDSSIQGDLSVSRTVSASVVARLRELDPGLAVVTRDLAADPIDHLTLAEFGQPTEALREFQAADIVVIGAGLYNFTVPSQLKAWIDRIVIRGETFRYDETGPVGLAAGKRIILVLGRGGVYAEGTPYAAFEHAETLLRGIFGFICNTIPEVIVAEGVARGEEMRAAAIAAALDRAARLEIAA